MQGELGWITVHIYSLKRFSSTWSNKKNSSGEIYWKNQAKKVITGWIHQAWMDSLEGWPCRYYHVEGQILTLEMGISQAEANESEEEASVEEDNLILSAEEAGKNLE